MELLANDLSVHEQFHDLASFREALAGLMAMRNIARGFAREVYCHRAFLATNPMPGVPMQKAIGHLTRDERQAALGWLATRGPFWDDLRQHDAGDWLECRDKVVTESAVGEAAFRTLHGMGCGLISLAPSDWHFSPLEVTWRRAAEGLDDQSTALENWSESAALEDWLREAAPPIRSWVELREVSTNRFGSLTFAGDCFEPLHGVPWAKSVAERLFVLLDTLNRLACAFDKNGAWTAEGQRIFQNYFTGDRAAFSDSSNTEKQNFHNELAFPHPGDPGKRLFCPWHGKVSHGAHRLHFSWPIVSGKPVYVVYAGPKITKR